MNFKFRTISKDLPYFVLQICDHSSRVITSYIVSSKNYTFFAAPSEPYLEVLYDLINDKQIELIEKCKNVVGDDTYTCKLTPKLILAIL